MAIDEMSGDRKGGSGGARDVGLIIAFVVMALLAISFMSTSKDMRHSGNCRSSISRRR